MKRDESGENSDLTSLKTKKIVTRKFIEKN